jgi:deazaflavin-dependent oxidoreductase (nitroreductase family)
MAKNLAQKPSREMKYPAPHTLASAFYKAPLFAYRLGFGRFLGHFFLLLTTWGRHSGMARSTMLSYAALDGVLYVISGWGLRSDWYRNLMVDPRVTVQIGKAAFPARARRVTEEAEFRRVMFHMLATSRDPYLKPWLASLGLSTDLEELVKNQERLHLVALERSMGSGPPALTADLTWLWPFSGLVFTVGWLLGRFSQDS